MVPPPFGGNLAPPRTSYIGNAGQANWEVRSKGAFQRVGVTLTTDLAFERWLLVDRFGPQNLNSQACEPLDSTVGCDRQAVVSGRRHTIIQRF